MKLELSPELTELYNQIRLKQGELAILQCRNNTRTARGKLKTEIKNDKKQFSLLLIQIVFK
jgi:hypothetical protein